MRAFVRRGAALAVFAASLIVVGNAAATPLLEKFKLTPASTAAGAHSNVLLSMGFAHYPGPHAHTLTIHLAPGLMGDPSTTPRCKEAAFKSDSCPDGAKVGSVAAGATVKLLFHAHQSVEGDVYNLEPASSAETSRLGIVMRPSMAALTGNLYFDVPVKVRSEDGGLDSSIDNIPSKIGPAETWIENMDVTFFGVTPSGGTFMTNPTACIPATSSVEALASGSTQWETLSSQFTPTGCESVTFTPSLTVTPASKVRGQTSAYTVGIDYPHPSGSITQAHLKRVAVTLPVGTTISPGVATGLTRCADEQFGSDPRSPSNCPESSQVGTVSFTMPALGELQGQVYLGTPHGADQFPLLISIGGPGMQLKPTGAVSLDPNTGQVTAVFDNLLQVPFTHMGLTFFGGEKALLANPNTCGQHTVTARLTPWSAAPTFAPTDDRVVTTSFSIDADGKGGACAPPSFAPNLSASVTNTQAGAPTGALNLTASVPEGNESLSSLQIDLPAGLAGHITKVVPCSTLAASTGTCGEESSVGSAITTIGPGSAPVSITGKVFLTGPSFASPLGMSVVLAARIGSIDLGHVIVPASVGLRRDAGLSVKTAPFPPFVSGVPAAVRALKLTLDRPGFLVNPTSCNQLTVAATLFGSNGSKVHKQAPFATTGCERLEFAPTISGTLTASEQAGARSNPSVNTVVSLPAGNATTKSLTVTFPRSIGVNLQRLTSICSAAQLEAGNCPESAQVGTASARTPLLPVGLTGPVYLAQGLSGELPRLSLFLNGPLAMRFDGDVKLSASGIQTTFADLPDIPLERFELSLAGGPTGSLTSNSDPCHGHHPLIRADFLAHNGKAHSQSTSFAVTGCTARLGKHVHLRPARSSAIWLRIHRHNKTIHLRRVELSVLAPWRVNPRGTYRRIQAWVDGQNVVQHARLSANKITIVLPARSARNIIVGIRANTIITGAHQSAKSPRRLPFRARAIASNGRRTAVRVQRIKAWSPQPRPVRLNRSIHIFKRKHGRS